MDIISFKHEGTFRKSDNFFKRLLQLSPRNILYKYGQMGVDALSAATPVDSSKTSKSWSYTVEKTARGYALYWSNSNVVNNVNIAVILQYGHGTRGGGYVNGRDYINPAIQPIFDKIAEEAWREVTK